MSDENEFSVGGEEPLKPRRSLPSYWGPTPETHRKLTREEEAELALKHSSFAAGTMPVLIAFFLITILTVPGIQFVSEWRAHHSLRLLPTILTFSQLTSRCHLTNIHKPGDLWQMLPRPAETKTVEKTLENDSVVAQWLLPRAQSVIVTLLHGGSEQAYLGHNNWLFYRTDVDYVIGEDFLDPSRLKRRRHVAGVQPNAIEAIVDFRNQLAQRGIELVIVPVPVKPAIDGDQLAITAKTRPLENGSFQQFREDARRNGVRLFDAEAVLNQKPHDSPFYLKADTHWRPEAMEYVAEELAKYLNLPPGSANIALRTQEQSLASIGDVARMLKLPGRQTARYQESATIHQVFAGNSAWRATKDSDVLLLGDSFSNIFSQGALGWGEAAGFAEQLSRALQGRPLDCILRNSDGAFATREILSRELARGRDRLASKKVVIWEFANRELMFGNWKPLDMKLGPPAPAHFLTPAPGEQLAVKGTIAALSPVPQPGTVPYADHIMALHLVDVNVPTSHAEGMQALVYVLSMRNNVWTPAARLRLGDRVTLRLRAWSDVAKDYEQINRSEVEDAAVQLEEPAWGELIGTEGR